MNNENEEKESRFYKFAKGKGVMNLPNKLTISRVVMIPLFVLFCYLNFTAHFFVALVVFAVASLTDLFDGKIARKYNLVTNLGKFLDPIADKVLVLSALVVFLTMPQMFTLYANLGSWTMIAAGCGVAVILAREIIVSGFRMVAAGAGIVIAADIFGKYKTVSQFIAIIIMLIAAGVCELSAQFGADVLIAGQIIMDVGLVFFAISVLLTIISGVNYIVKNIDVLKK